MLHLILSLLLGVVSLVSGAALRPIREVKFETSAVDNCDLEGSVVTSVVTVPPSIITVAVEDSASIASSLSRAASIDSVQVSDSSELVPVSDTISGPVPLFTHSIVVPAFTASETAQGTSIWFVSIGPNTTNWNYTPTNTGELTVGLTTVTVAPLPSLPPSNNATELSSTVSQGSPIPTLPPANNSAALNITITSEVPAPTAPSNNNATVGNSTLGTVTPLQSSPFQVTPTGINGTRQTVTAQQTQASTITSSGSNGTLPTLSPLPPFPLNISTTEVNGTLSVTVPFPSQPPMTNGTGTNGTLSIVLPLPTPTSAGSTGLTVTTLPTLPLSNTTGWNGTVSIVVTISTPAPSNATRQLNGTISTTTPVSTPFSSNTTTGLNLTQTFVTPLSTPTPSNATAGSNSTSATVTLLPTPTPVSASIGLNGTSRTVVPLSTLSTINGTGPNSTYPTTYFSHISKTKSASHTLLTPYSQGWNQTAGLSNSQGPTVITGVTTGTAPGIGSGTASESSQATAPGTAPQITVTTFETVALTTVSVTVFPTYGFNPGGPILNLSTSTTTSEYEYVLEKRQTCTLVSATFGNGQVESWCNNWDGTTVNQQSTYQTTFTPGPVSTITSPTPSSASGISLLSSSLTTSPQSASSTVSAPTSTGSCGWVGDFIINFDDLPEYAAPSNAAETPTIVVTKGNPYHDLYWGEGWAFVPPPNDPYLAQSGDHLAEYIPSLAGGPQNSSAGGILPIDSAFGAGPLQYDSARWFNARSAYVGCNNSATDPSVTCDFVATGYQWNQDLQEEEVAVTQHFTLAPCPNLQNCVLQPMVFGPAFTGLCSLAFYAVVEGQITVFFIDTIGLTWFNNTCEAGQARGPPQ